jgi:hypothetical protein
MMREAAENKRRADDYEKRLNALLEKGEAEARAREEARNRDEEAKRQQLAQEAVDRRRLLAQQDDERKKLANEQQERDAARQRVAALLAAREQQARDEAARQLAEKQEAERQRIAEDLNKQQSEAERQKREAQLLLDQEAERKRLVEQLAAKKREDDLVAQRAEAERKKKEDDDQKRRIAEICVRETATLDGMTTSRQRANVEAMRGQTLCPTIGAKIDLALKTIDTALAQACATDRKTLSAAARTPDAIRAVREGMTCDAAKSEAAVQVARLEEDALKAQQACITDQAAFSAIDRTALDARDKLKALSGRLVCVSMNADINKLVVEIESRTKSAQTALRDLGCYSGQATGVFDVVTRRALVSYFGLRGAKFEDTQHVNDEVIEDLKAQPRNFCKPAEPQAPVAVGPSKASKPVAARPVEKIERVKRAAPAPAPAPVKAARAPREPRQMIPTPIATARPAPAAVSRPTISGVGF